MRIAIIILIVGVIVSCNSKAYRAIVAVDKGFHIDSAAAEKRAKQIAPCITVSQDTTPPVTVITNTTDTITKTVTDTVKLKCKDGSEVDTIITKKYYDINHRYTKTNTFYIIKTIEDKGKDIIIRDLQSKLGKEGNKKDFWMGWAIIATIIVLVGVIIYLVGKSLKPKRI